MRFRDESGAILIQAALSMLILIGFTAFVFDHGVLMVARNQAQNTADAAALAGTIARAFDEVGPTPAPDGITVKSIQWAVTNNWIFSANTHTALWSWACPSNVPPGARCTRVEIYRNGTNGSTTLPMFFGAAFGANSQATKAMAIGAAEPANGSNCLKPWLIPDKYEDVNGNGVYDAPVNGVGGDRYTAPGWTLEDVGTVLTLNPGSPSTAAASSNFYQVDVTNYLEDIETCRLVRALGETINTAPGISNGLTRRGVDTLTMNGPVVVPIGMFSPVQFEANRQTGNFTLTIVNMMGFRLEGLVMNSLYGTIVAAPGEIVPSAAPPVPNASFLSAIRLVR